METFRFNHMLLSIAFFAFSSCSPKIHQTLLWQSQPPVFDQPESWINTVGHDERSGIHYVMSNDRDNLYVVISTDDDATKIRMLRGGMQLMIDTLGRHQGHGIITFPLKQETSFAAGLRGGPSRGLPGESPPRTPGDPSQRSGARRADGENDPDRTAMFNHLIGLQTHVLIHGFKDHRQGRNRAMREDGIRVSLDLDSAGFLNYRAVIPLTTFFRELVDPDDTKKVFGLEVKVNGLEFPGRPPAGSVSGGRGTSGVMGPGNTGNMRGSPSRGQDGSRGGYVRPNEFDGNRDLGKTLSFRSTFSLAMR